MRKVVKSWYRIQFAVWIAGKSYRVAVTRNKLTFIGMGWKFLGKTAIMYRFGYEE